MRNSEDERAPERKEDLGAQLDELGTDPRQVGPRSAGQAGDSQRLSTIEDASDESVEELEDSDQSLEAAAWRVRKMRPIIPSVQRTRMKSMAAQTTFPHAMEI
jgi:hypothetical protein